MTYKWTNLAFLVLIACVGAGYIWMSGELAMTRLSTDLRPILFPVALGVGVVVLSLIELYRTLRRDDPDQQKPFQIEGALYLFGTVVLIASYYVVWETLGVFYVATGLLVLALILFYRGRPTGRDAVIAAAVALAFALILYFVFHLAFGIKFTH